ncbi:MAG: ABC transporter A family member [Bacilli bacterium]
MENNAIEIKNLVKNYQTTQAVKNVSFSIKEGEIFGLLGVNGAGKTTIIKILSCLIKPTSGEVLVLGHSIATDFEYIKTILDVSPQETAIAPLLTVRENLEFMAALYGIKKEDIKEEVRKTAESLNLEEVMDKKGKTLSGGWQRRLSIALALISNPKILILDEPTLGLDILARRELWSIIESLRGKKTIILTTHYLEEAEALCSRIAIMAKGELKGLGTVDELKKQGKDASFENAFINIATEKVGE